MDAALAARRSPCPHWPEGILPAQQQRILATPPHVKGCSLPLTSVRDGPRPPLTRDVVPGLERPAAGQDARPQASVERATCVPDQADTQGRQRSTTVTDM
jgi:hypothetical protein